MGLNEWFKSGTGHREGKVVQVLQPHPTLRTVIYIVGSGATIRGDIYLYNVSPYRGREAEGDLVSRLTVTPCILALTWSFARLRKEDIARWNRIPLQDGIFQTASGIELGTSGFLLTLGIAYQRGWVAIPDWGWKNASKAEIARTLVIPGAQYAAVSWNEEMIYRGYGLDTALDASSGYIAIPALASISALAHGPGWQGFVSHGTMALISIALRLGSDSLWLPVGYHFAWNYVQTAVLGPSDGRPSLLPIHVDGPKLWVGSPGHSEPPGLLVAIAHAIIGVIYALVRRR